MNTIDTYHRKMAQRTATTRTYARHAAEDGATCETCGTTADWVWVSFGPLSAVAMAFCGAHVEDGGTLSDPNVFVERI